MPFITQVRDPFLLFFVVDEEEELEEESNEEEEADCIGFSNFESLHSDVSKDRREESYAQGAT